jgi:hypothetical protein
VDWEIETHDLKKEVAGAAAADGVIARIDGARSIAAAEEQRVAEGAMEPFCGYVVPPKEAAAAGQSARNGTTKSP